MKRVSALWFFPVWLSALQPNPIPTQIVFSGEAVAALKAVHQGFNAVGYKFDITAVTAENSSGKVSGTAVGIRPFSVEAFGENLKEEGLLLESIGMEQGVLKLKLDAKNALWNAPLIGNDEGVQLERSNGAKWFRVQSGQTIRIEPPYTGKWYPDIAIFDASFRVLYSYRSQKAKDQFEFELPEGAHYLKVSNVWGMKVLKEGTWIESITPGRQER